MPKEQSDLAVRKKMRKGTHSCFECRRRKIRCIFPPDNPDICSECFARGSRCIDQEHASPDIIVDHRKNLRERVSRLEALVDSLLEDKAERSQSGKTDITTSSQSKTPHLVTKDTFPPTPLSSENSSTVFPAPNPPRAQGNHVPILSAFEDALNDASGRCNKDIQQMPHLPVAPNAAERYTVTARNHEDMNMIDQNSAGHQAKRERIKQALLAALPSYDRLQKIFASNGDWWRTWRLKCSGTSQPGQTLSEFAAKAIQESNIGGIGITVLSLGICLAEDTDVEKYIEVVDRYVLSDDEYAATLEGMECLILKSKWYADIGQPRRAWISYRKGLMYAQLMGLHRQRTSSPAHESVWWALYHGDRLISLLLGLPYGILDSHCDLTLPDMGSGPYIHPLHFVNKLSVLAGKVIDRNQSVGEQSFAWALQLDQELEDLWKQLDPNWLEYASLLVDVEKNAADLRERLMGQMMYHQIRVYLHLPFMLKSQSNPRFAFSRTACLNGSRQALKLYQAMRTGEVQPLYECKALDFMGFTAAVLITLGIFNFGGAAGGMAAKDQEADTRLIEVSIDIFRRASSEKGGKVALQSAEVLENMLQKLASQSGCPEMKTEFVIPYFGTISIKRGGQHKPPGTAAAAAAAAPGFAAQSRSGPSKSSSTSTTRRQNSSMSTAASLTPTSEHTSGSDIFSAGQPLTSTTPTSSLNFNTDPFVSYDGFYNWPVSHTAENPSSSSSASLNTAGSSAGGLGANIQVNDDSMNNFPLPTNNFSWQNMPMDIDQDWSWFLNDGLQSQPVEQSQAGLGDMFTQQTFAGFG